MSRQGRKSKQPKTPQQKYERAIRGLSTDALFESLKGDYPDLDPDHIKALIKAIDYDISSPFNPAYKARNEEKSSFVQLINSTANGKEINPEEITEQSLRELYLINNRLENINILFKGHGLAEVEKPEEYLDLIKKLTTERSELIINTLTNTGIIPPQKQELEQVAANDNKRPAPSPAAPAGEAVAPKRARSASQVA